MYVFFDIDGTLISHRGISHIPDETRKAVNELKAHGHVPAIATGRTYFLAKNAAKEFGIEYLVCSGGSEIIVRGEKIYEKYFPDEHIKSFVKVAEKFPKVCAAVDDKYLYAGNAFSDFFAYFNSQAGYDCIRPLSEMKRAIICYIMLPHETLTHEHGIFYSPPEGVRLELMHQFTEARHASASKWNGIEMLIANEGASLDDVIVFGDGPNDIEMIERAKIGVAVERAGDDVKIHADYVCEDIDDGGILKACEHLGLIA